MADTLPYMKIVPNQEQKRVISVGFKPRSNNGIYHVTKPDEGTTVINVQNLPSITVKK